ELPPLATGDEELQVPGLALQRLQPLPGPLQVALRECPVAERVGLVAGRPGEQVQPGEEPVDAVHLVVHSPRPPAVLPPLPPAAPRRAPRAPRRPPPPRGPRAPRAPPPPPPPAPAAPRPPPAGPPGPPGPPPRLRGAPGRTPPPGATSRGVLAGPPGRNPSR